MLRHSLASAMMRNVVVIGILSLLYRNAFSMAVVGGVDAFICSPTANTNTKPATATIMKHERKRLGNFGTTMIQALATPELQDETPTKRETIPTSIIQDQPNDNGNDNDNENDITLLTNSQQIREQAAELDWSFINQVYLITCPNADPNSERLNEARDILTQVGLGERVQIKAFDTDDEDRIRGCYMSHISVIQDALHDIDEDKKDTQRNAGSTGSGGDWWKQLFSFMDEDSSSKIEHSTSTSTSTTTDASEQQQDQQEQQDQEPTILVLEDNIAYNGKLTPSILNSISTFLTNDTSAQVFHLSYIPYVPNLIVSKTSSTYPQINKLTCGIGSALGTTAYIMKQSAMKDLLKQHDRRGYYAAIPDVMAELFPNSRYGCNPIPFLRAPQTKSLVNPQLDDLRSVLFQPSVVTTVQSILASTGLSSNTLFFIMVGSLVVSMGLSGKVAFDAFYQIVEYGSYDGNVVLPTLSLMVTLGSLGVLAFGAALAPKPPPQEEQEEQAGEKAD